MPTADRRAPFVLAVAVLGISCAEPLIRLSAAAPLAIATWRMGFAMAVVGLVLVVSGGWHQWRTLTRQEFGLSIAAGVSLAVHFWSWNASLEYTSMAASVLLVNLQPVVVAAISARWLGALARRAARGPPVGGNRHRDDGRRAQSSSHSPVPASRWPGSGPGAAACSGTPSPSRAASRSRCTTRPDVA